MPPTQVHSIPGLKNLFNACSQEVQLHYEHLPSLLDHYPLEVALGYMFHRLELGQNMALYCGVVKLHRASSEVARNAIDVQCLTRKLFPKLYETVYNFALPQIAKQELETAEKTRDTIMHGGDASADRLRNAIGRVLEFSEGVNNQIQKQYNFQPFRGNWQGFAGALQKLNNRTTRYMLKGMGFGIA